VYVPEPPLGVVVNVLFWPISIVHEEGDMLTVGAAFTVTETALEVIAAVAASVTWSWKFQVPVVVEVVVVKVYVVDVAPLMGE
jgi:hypothetical protein